MSLECNHCSFLIPLLMYSYKSDQNCGRKNIREQKKGPLISTLELSFVYFSTRFSKGNLFAVESFECFQTLGLFSKNFYMKCWFKYHNLVCNNNNGEKTKDLCKMASKDKDYKPYNCSFYLEWFLYLEL